MALKSLPAVYMRGGTSRALVFRKEDLPADPKLWDGIFLSALGSPDAYGRQLDGMGGGISSLSKVCVLSPSQRDDADVDYTFAQVSVHESNVDYKGNCGNISSVVGPFALAQGWCQAPGAEACVRIFNTNTRKIIHAYFPAQGNQPVYDGDLQIPGVSGTGAAIRLEFQNPGGATTGHLFPTKEKTNRLMYLGKEIEASLVDAANPVVFVRAADVGVSGFESPEELSAHKEVLAGLDELRRQAAVAMGLAADLDVAKNLVSVPYVGLVSPSLDGTASFNMRVIAGGQPHKALPLTVSLCAAVASQIPGTVVAGLAKAGSEEIHISMPSGILTLSARVQERNGQWEAVGGSFFRTARPLFAGTVFYRE
ncbi:PrpF family protein [Bdellovibrio bacteriovorus]|uniref:2-methylaconitate cis-trans isomerase PrpF family protein n=1 Tax=Bdellovibrio bacteriovorus TaxID=959 RepID=UPI0021D15AE6|nr:PrpF domain-containing protein [Bdellovibrio bacteriovorus]UXR66059.1 PrpF family protein [Bdellovibrio bacteriovorus]